MGKTVVLGLGISGVAAAKFLVKQGQSVIGVDGRLSVPETATSLFYLKELGVFLQVETDPIDWSLIDQIVVSPGISPDHPIYKEATLRKIPVLGEAELALPYLQKKKVAITGTNGKTTVTLLIEHILNFAGIRAKALGNVGVALCDYLVSDGPEDVCVIELSSYQLETLKTPVFESAVLLNITPDHLDRYASMQDYAAAKCRLESLVIKPKAFFAQKSAVEQYPDLFQSPQLFGSDPSCDLWTDQTCIFEKQKIACLLPIDYKNRGKHDCENAIAAWVICQHLGVLPAVFTEALATFCRPPHRIEWVAQIKEVTYYDDSKGTNIDAVIQAVNSMQSKVILIVGGVDKGSSYLPWKDCFGKKVRQLIAIGQASAKIQQELSPHFPIICADSLEQAVHLAAALAKTGESVLLSPGCSSFDQFRDYVHRGEEFQKHVKNLRKEI